MKISVARFRKEEEEREMKKNSKLWMKRDIGSEILGGKKVK